MFAMRKKPDDKNARPTRIHLTRGTGITHNSWGPCLDVHPVYESMLRVPRQVSRRIARSPTVRRFQSHSTHRRPGTASPTTAILVSPNRTRKLVQRPCSTSRSHIRWDRLATMRLDWTSRRRWKKRETRIRRGRISELSGSRKGRRDLQECNSSRGSEH